MKKKETHSDGLENVRVKIFLLKRKITPNRANFIMLFAPCMSIKFVRHCALNLHSQTVCGDCVSECTVSDQPADKGVDFLVFFSDRWKLRAHFCPFYKLQGKCSELNGLDALQKRFIWTNFIIQCFSIGILPTFVCPRNANKEA